MLTRIEKDDVYEGITLLISKSFLDARLGQAPVKFVQNAMVYAENTEV